MTGWTITAVLLGAIVGAVAKGVFDQWNGRTSRLLDEKLKQAVAFLGAADKGRRLTQDHLYDAVQLRTVTDDARRQQLEGDMEKRLTGARDAFSEAEEAYNALRFLLPTTASYASKYLGFCRGAGPYSDDATRDERERVRQTVESEIQRVLRA